MRYLYYLALAVMAGCIAEPFDHNLRLGPLEGDADRPLRLSIEEEQSEDGAPSSNLARAAEALSATTVTVAGTPRIEVPGLPELGLGIGRVAEGFEATLTVVETASPENSPSSHLQALGQSLSAAAASLSEALAGIPAAYAVTLSEGESPESSPSANLRRAATAIAETVDKLVGDSEEPALKIVEGLVLGDKNEKLVSQVLLKAGVYLLLILGIGLLFVKDLKTVDPKRAAEVIRKYRFHIYGGAVLAGGLVAWYEGSNLIHYGHDAMDTWGKYWWFGIQFPVATLLCAQAGLWFFRIRCELHGDGRQVDDPRTASR